MDVTEYLALLYRFFVGYIAGYGSGMLAHVSRSLTHAKTRCHVAAVSCYVANGELFQWMFLSGRLFCIRGILLQFKGPNLGQIISSQVVHVRVCFLYGLNIPVSMRWWQPVFSSVGLIMPEHSPIFTRPLSEN